MKSKFFWIIGCFIAFSAITLPLQAAYTLKKGRLVNVDEIARYSAQEHFAMGGDAMEAEDWKEAAKQFCIVVKNFPNTPYSQEALYYLGVSYYHLKEYDFASQMLSDYLKVQNNPRFFQETIEYKFAIAERFKEGAKRRFFGAKKFPKWASGTAMSLKIYDEVIAAVPSHDIAARALVAKGSLLWKMKDYRSCVEAFQMVIRRFPKHELAPECYLYISRVFVEQSQIEFQNPDLLAFAQINVRKFKNDFPREERICEAELNVQAIKEIYARGLYETGQFYERKCKKQAAIIYYYNAIHQFPDTCISELCRERLSCLDPCYQEANVSELENDQEIDLTPQTENLIDFEQGPGS